THPDPTSKLGFFRNLLVAVIVGKATDDAEREHTDPDPEQDPVVGHVEHPHQDDAEAREGDEGARHHQAETGLGAHGQMTASRRRRSTSWAAPPAPRRIWRVCSPGGGGWRSGRGPPCSSRKPAPTSRIGP